VASFSHTYDVRGNLKALAELGATKNYTYDQLERLTAVARAQANGTSTPAEAYSYDGEGNRTASKSESGPQQTYVTDERNRILDDGVNTYTWGANNALASRTPKAGGATLTFDSSWQAQYNQIRLDRVYENGVQRHRFAYDALNRLGYTQHQDPARGTAYNFFDGDDMHMELRNAEGPGPRQWARYIHGPNADQPLAFELYAPNAQPTPGTGQVFYYHADAEGSIRLLTDALCGSRA
jgi:YD repeat-containing protein